MGSLFEGRQLYVWYRKEDRRRKREAGERLGGLEGMGEFVNQVSSPVHLQFGE